MFKKAISLLAACALCIGFAIPTFAATVTEDKYTLSFGENEITEETLTFYEYDNAQDKAVGVPKTVKAVHMNVGDTVTFTQNAEQMLLHMDFQIWTSGDVGYSSSAVISTTLDATQTVKIPDPIPMHNYLASQGDDITTAKYIIKCGVSVVGDETLLDTYYIVLDSVKSDNAPAKEENSTTTEKPTNPADTAPATTVEASGSMTYTVQKYDTLGHLSVNYYGNYNYHQAIANANKDAFKKTNGKLVPGMVLTLPATIAKGVNIIAAPVAGDGEKLYTVKSGDTLGTIAQAIYGNSNNYKAIYDRNTDRLKNVNTIYEGQVIVLPAK